MTKEITPWHPSKKAIARVTNPLTPPIDCNFCGGKIEIARNGEVYGKDYGDWPWVYLCRSCGAMVGMHPLTSIPLGIMADKSTRDARKVSKEPFEELWKSGRMTRSEAYRNLAAFLGIPVDSCHFAWFDTETCRRAKEWAEEIPRP